MKDDTADKQIAQEEEKYEKESRKIKKLVPDVVDLLPFKTADGSLVYDKSRSTEATLSMVCSHIMLWIILHSLYSF